VYTPGRTAFVVPVITVLAVAYSFKTTAISLPVYSYSFVITTGSSVSEIFAGIIFYVADATVPV
jgi:hypothetical protein